MSAYMRCRSMQECPSLVGGCSIVQQVASQRPSLKRRSLGVKRADGALGAVEATTWRRHPWVACYSRWTSWWVPAEQRCRGEEREWLGAYGRLDVNPKNALHDPRVLRQQRANRAIDPEGNGIEWCSADATAQVKAHHSGGLGVM